MSPLSEVQIERVAKFLCETGYKDWLEHTPDVDPDLPQHSEPWDTAGPSHRRNWLAIARALAPALELPHVFEWETSKSLTSVVTAQKDDWDRHSAAVKAIVGEAE